MKSEEKENRAKTFLFPETIFKKHSDLLAILIFRSAWLLQGAKIISLRTQHSRKTSKAPFFQTNRGPTFLE